MARIRAHTQDNIDFHIDLDRLGSCSHSIDHKIFHLSAADLQITEVFLYETTAGSGRPAAFVTVSEITVCTSQLT